MDIEKAIDNDAFISALALALTIPDVCGSRLFPKTGVGKRYVKWFDEYVAASYMQDPDNPMVCRDRNGSRKDRYFCGDDCYALRCVFLHEGTNVPHVEKGKTSFNAIQFHIFALKGGDSISYVSDSNGMEYRKVDLDIPTFVSNLAKGVDLFLKDYPEMNDDKGSECLMYQPILDFRSPER